MGSRERGLERVSVGERVRRQHCQPTRRALPRRPQCGAPRFLFTRRFLLQRIPALVAHREKRQEKARVAAAVESSSSGGEAGALGGEGCRSGI